MCFPCLFELELSQQQSAQGNNNKVHRANEALKQLRFAFLSYLEQGAHSLSVFCNYYGRSFAGNHCLRIEEFFFL